MTGLSFVWTSAKSYTYLLFFREANEIIQSCEALCEYLINYVSFFCDSSQHKNSLTKRLPSSRNALPKWYFSKRKENLNSSDKLDFLFPVFPDTKTALLRHPNCTKLSRISQFWYRFTRVYGVGGKVHATQQATQSCGSQHFHHAGLD